MFAKSILTKGGNVFRDERSLAFGGTDEYLDCGSNHNLGTSDFTITAWVKASDFNLVYIVSKRQDNDNRYYLRCTDENPPIMHFYSKIDGANEVSYIGGSNINLDNLQNQWVHFAISADRDGNIVGYINGILDDTETADATNIDNTGDFYIGRFSSTYSECNISEVAIYNSALSANQVKTLYNGREPYNHKEGVASGNLQSWYRMGDGALDDFNLIGDETNATLGSNLITNGTFDADSDWSKGTGWTIGSGVVTCSSDNNNLTQDVSAVANKVYKINFDITAYTSGTLAIDVGGSSNIQFSGSTGNFTGYMLTANTNDLRFYGGAFRGTVDNIRVFKVFGNPGVTYNMTADDFEGDTP